MRWIDRASAYPIRECNRVQASPKAGLRQTWTEYQVFDGRKIIGRFERLVDAEKFSRSKLEERWNEIGKIQRGGK